MPKKVAKTTVSDKKVEKKTPEKKTHEKKSPKKVVKEEDTSPPNESEMSAF
jgi:hypothetical protein